ncbi:hypothetical protein JCM18903_3168 [Psychrobacter sp. JCM 18903]|uniref:hypothetical protein n=1 Tax=Psychrobacter sp. JCM 18903 TaxID=1298610 RepID=UPI0004334100|nr:hypothetical protein [Psychrobacter sp. JCM 18903]GAF63045.1 hypothetical protein JCM18903_3168 [Psychrobacter sp. JCM 18903]
MIEDKHSQFAKHINELQEVLESPYSSKIDKALLKDSEDIEHLNKEIANINPDYMTFLPSYFWYWYFGIGWVYFSSCMFFIVFFADLFRHEPMQGLIQIFNIASILFMFITLCTPLLLLLYQFIRKHPYRIQYYFLKKEQKVVYYYRPSLQFFKPFELKIVDYKDIIPEVHTIKNNTAYTPLNLYIADSDTGDITHHIKPHDVSVDPRVHWAFIRTYMEGDAADLPINPEFCQAYPADTSKSLFACSDIVFRKNGILPNDHSGGGQIMVFIIGSLFTLGYLLQGNNYQTAKQAILHPDVQKLLTWDGQDNPYPIQPITDEAKLAFEGRNWEVNVRWVYIILINVGLFVWAVLAYNS